MFKGLGQIGDMAKMMKQAQEMQSKMADAQKMIDQIEDSGESGGGLVKATTSAKGGIIRLDLDPTILNPNEKQVVEDLIIAAIKDAQEKAVARTKSEMLKITEGMEIPDAIKDKLFP